MRQLARREVEPPSFFESFVRRLRELALGESANGDLRETIEDLIEEAKETGPTLGQEERILVHNAFEFGELRVDDVMVPRADIRSIDACAGIHEVIGALQAAGHSRLVVYGGGLDDVLGVIHIKDLLPFWADGASFALEQVVRPLLVVPPSMRAMDLLLEMRTKRNHAAVVVDEFGGIDGLVTVGDLLEQLVGELQDEHDLSTPPQIVANADGTWDADGRVDLEEVEAQLGVSLLDEEERDEADTLGGLIFGLVDRVPARGRRGRAPERLCLRGAGRRSAPHQAGAHPPASTATRAGRGVRRARELSTLAASARTPMAVTAADRLRSWPLAASLLAGLAVGLAVPPLWFLPGLLGFCRPGADPRTGLRPAPCLYHRDAVRLRLLHRRPLLGRDRLLRRRRALRSPRHSGGRTVVPGPGHDDRRRHPHRRRLALAPGVVPRALALAVVWSVTEIVRDHLLQFPWNPIAVVWAISDPTLQAIAWFGCTGLGLITVAVAASARPTASRGAAVVLLPLLLVATGEVRLHWLTPLADSHPVALRLVQADVPQTMKWDPQRARDWFERHLTLSQAPRATPAQVVIWPESAVPYEIEREPLVRDLIARVLPPGAVAIVGGDRFEGVGPTAVGHNSVFAIDDRGRIVEHYDKVDLVPFGEFLPFRRYLGAVGLDKTGPGPERFTPGSAA